MSAKTRIVVLHMKEVIYTAIFVGLGIVLIILLLFMFLPKKQKGDAEPTMQYTAGVYTSSVMMGSQSADVQVISLRSIKGTFSLAANQRIASG